MKKIKINKFRILRFILKVDDRVDSFLCKLSGIDRHGRPIKKNKDDNR